MMTREELEAAHRICGAVHPSSGRKCGLYEWHVADRVPHRILKRDYRHSPSVQKSAVIEWWDDAQLIEPHP